jgi:hypothetical protein
MAEQPEQVLPQQRVAAARRVEKRQVKRPLGLEQGRGQDQRREGHHHHQPGDQHVPPEDRHPVERHAGGAHLQDRDDGLDRERERRDLDEGHAEQPHIGVDARRIDVGAQRRIHEPAAIGRDAGQQRHGQDGAAEQVAPIAVGGEARKREIAGAENLRGQIDGNPFHHRHGEQKQHHRAVHREDLVVGLRVHEGRPGGRELNPGQHAEHAADREEGEGRGHEAQADDGMIDRGEAPEAGPRAPDRGEPSVQYQRRAAPRRRACGIAHRPAPCPAAARASAAGKSLAASTTTTKRIAACPRPQNSEHSAS